ncbi:zinc-dependent alcohol dehydrogenase family protein [Neorhodopirellula pilleata]|uniref:enoyl-[acyl-carrier-protein] reductase n=1 Tax=Neorhodopirellula pilleata TaxID=2714738 RepID=A0A5C6A0M2_9BACT|nr:zinc-dependent alcohol dehydrogenase family protein [Neorhodopirellula pilleata]TWT93119.1 Quinone oxidoreductase 1 [Neorhodopirellula pilleata]
MKQIIYERFGPPSVVAQCQEVADPTSPSAWEVMVSIDSFPINPADLAMIRGQYGVLNQPPATIGMEAVGTVVEVGRSVSHLEVGNRVLLLANNNWATLRKVPASLTVKVPDDLDPLQLSMLKVSGMTAHWLTSQIEPIRDGELVVQNAPLSAVGRYVIQLAKARGFRTVNLVRRPEQIAETERLGGDINLLDEDGVDERLRSELNGQAIKLGLDAVAGESTDRIAACLADGGMIVNYGMLSVEPCRLNPMHTIFRNIQLTGFWLSKILNRLSAQERQSHILELVDLLASQKLHSDVDSVFSIDEISNAITRAEQPGRSGKVFISTNPADRTSPSEHIE